MTGLLLLAAIALCVAAALQATFSAARHLPFAGVNAATYWVLVALATVFGIAALITHITETNGVLP